MKEIVGAVMVAILVLILIYGMYCIGKTISYNIFYEDMVQQTVRELVKPESLQ